MQYPSEEVVKFLGNGVYGCVDLVKFTNSFLAAVKTCQEGFYDSLYKEVGILSELSGSPNIVQSFGDDLEEDLDSEGRSVFKLLLEYASHGSLRAFMDTYTDRKLPEPMIRDLTRMILQDFGNSIEAGEIPQYWAIDYPFVGTANYMPPESFRNGVANKTLDLWSLGCLVLEMYTAQVPWKGVKTKDIEPLLFDGKAPESVPCDAREFIETCFARKPEDRGSASELLFHRFLLREEEKTEEKTEEKIIAVSVMARNSWLLNLKSRRALKKSMDAPEKPLKPKMSPPKSSQFKKFLNKFLRMKISL
ncbi:hypothetical protein AALP_AA8G255200 [Arabis alpina]|uniref:Protein kinase domain-containing protein n=1 Tax=Arabis alpina TaxID=50452 RepID=A0A087G9D2_ARAAL|nr:hypothetical protein AALP_AA8G255200 [Arabis alpina]